MVQGSNIHSQSAERAPEVDQDCVRRKGESGDFRREKRRNLSTRSNWEGCLGPNEVFVGKEARFRGQRKDKKGLVLFGFRKKERRKRNQSRKNARMRGCAGGRCRSCRIKNTAQNLRHGKKGSVSRRGCLKRKLPLYTRKKKSRKMPKGKKGGSTTR